MENIEKSSVKVERLGIFPLVLSILLELNLIEAIDKEYNHHGNWAGASKGVVLAVWISYIISECDHRLSRFQDWVKERELSLNTYLSEGGYSISLSDCTDDKLILLLEDFSDEDSWSVLETEINRKFISVYDLDGQTILDPTIGKSFKSAVEKGGLFQYGNSKHFRKDLPQFKTVRSNLSSCNFPLGSITVSGQQADDVLYIPMIKQAKQSFGKNGLLWKGDCKLSSMGNRKYIVGIEDYYLCPLPKTVIPKAKLYENYVKGVLEGIQVLEDITRGDEVIAQGFEVSETRLHEGLEWEERQLVIRSANYAESQCKSLDSRALKAGKALLLLNERKQGKRYFQTEQALHQACEKILKKGKVNGLLNIEYRITYEQKTKRAYKDKPERTETKMNYSIIVTKDEDAIKMQKDLLGWQVYVTNQPKENFTLQQAVLAYREEYKIERRIRNLKEEVTALLPVFDCCTH